MADNVAEIAETDPNALGWWCDACRRSGMIHCSEVEDCVESGQMAQLTWAERQTRHAAVRAYLENSREQ